MGERRRGLNVGCGKLLRESTDEMEWHNADVLPLPGVFLRFDAFRYPWPIPSGHYDEMYAGHIVEHIPHAFTVDHLTYYPIEQRPVNQEWLGRLAALPDGFFAWFAEAWRVLKMGGEITCEVPFGASTGALQDPGHVRSLVPSTLSYLCSQDSPTFDYRLPFTYSVVGVSYAVSQEYEGLPAEDIARLSQRLWNVIHTMRFTLRKEPVGGS